jgi:hypothetical protein
MNLGVADHEERSVEAWLAANPIGSLEHPTRAGRES